MKNFRIAIGADHRGFALKEFIKQTLDTDIIWTDVGCTSDERCDYPEFAVAVAQRVQKHEDDRGILLCGSGVGMSIVANRFDGIYAALAWDEIIARLSHEDDNSNILVLPADFVSQERVVDMIRTWLQSSFSGGRYAERIKQIDQLGGLKI